MSRSLSGSSGTRERLPALSAHAGYDRAMPEVAFVMSPRQDQSLRELAEALGHELGLQAVTSSVHLTGFPEPRPDRVYEILPLTLAAMSLPKAPRRCPTTRSWRGRSCCAPSRRRRTPAIRTSTCSGEGERCSPSTSGR